MLIADVHERIREHVLATVKSGQLSQRALGALVGMQQAHISNFLHGRRGLSIAGMDALLGVLGLDVADLLAMSGRMRGQTGCSIAFESVPLIHLRAAMNPTFSEEEILGELGFTKALLRTLKADHSRKRTAWVRFLAIRADSALAAPMFPRFENGSVLLVDRHHCSVAGYQKDEPNLYLIRKEETLMVRWAELRGAQLYLRPERNDYPLDFICIDRKNPLESCIVGRVAHIGTET
jgi:transcriptional regulator with XRE-family HTH domain